ncbi:MAG: respiratory nitrate reductase subunit gamma [Desulfobaccales bacterium]
MSPEPLWNLDFIAFAIYPYISLSVLILGSIYRYLKNPYSWNSESSELLSKDWGLMMGSYLFHYGILVALAGHVAGLLVPQRYYDFIGFTKPIHLFLAAYIGMLSGWAAAAGLLLLSGRRLLKRRVLLTSDAEDLITLLLLLTVVGLGTYNVTFQRWDNVLYDIAPWLRGIFIFAPNPELIANVPLTYKIHFLAVWTLLAFYPFSRLVHITSAPVTYIYRVWILFRRRCEGSWG